MAFKHAGVAEFDESVLLEGLHHQPLSHVAVHEGLRAAVVVVVRHAVALRDVEPINVNL
eukprot:CAMPEP_0177782818 /NCGR_PEP_ID=MMETSP0491_2-20121128/18728_1 /TAXON_ID=63592 /ORGANISM="Tetraselmis chuii, Strain PLY429" /LENGTH=58 /DNA_ID=CAMNT_0019303259 /DNA_START=408 /DNA_END=584 /DNA_ORIENTATION=-